MEKVSIIIPTYKRSEHLERAIKSCLNQTYKNIEIIVVDDNEVGSPDAKGTEKIVKKYNNVIYHKNKKNMGGALSRNEGVKRATGDFIAFLDDDDEYLPKKIELQLARYKEVNDPKCCLIYCYCNLINDGSITGVYKRDVEGDALYEHLLCHLAGTPALFMPKNVFDEIGGFENVKCCQEGNLVLKMLLKGYTVYRVPEVLLNIYVHSTTNNSGITSFNDKYIEGAKYYMERCLEASKKFSRRKQKKIKQIKYYWIFNMYYVMKNKNEKKEYLSKILKLKMLNFITFKSICKYLINNR